MFFNFCIKCPIAFVIVFLSLFWNEFACFHLLRHLWKHVCACLKRLSVKLKFQVWFQNDIWMSNVASLSSIFLSWVFKTKQAFFNSKSSQTDLLVMVFQWHWNQIYWWHNLMWDALLLSDISNKHIIYVSCFFYSTEIFYSDTNMWTHKHRRKLIHAHAHTTLYQTNIYIYVCVYS